MAMALMAAGAIADVTSGAIMDCIYRISEGSYSHWRKQSTHLQLLRGMSEWRCKAGVLAPGTQDHRMITLAMGFKTLLSRSVCEE